MKCLIQNSIATFIGLSFIVFCLLQEPIGHSAERRNAPENPNPLSGKVGDSLAGEWRVKCSVTTYPKEKSPGSSEDSGESLVVIESDSDGSYRLYKFPVGYGEGFSRLRKVSANRYLGEETVKGITTLVKQSAELEKGRIRITQTVIDVPNKRLQTETTCTGVRSGSDFRIPAAGRTAEICSSALRSGDLPDKRLARRYKSVKPFSDGLAAVAIVPRGERTEKWGFIDDTGRVVIPMRYDAVTSFCGGLAAVGKFYGRGRNLKWSVVEKLGPQVTPHVNYDAVKILGEGLAAVGYPVPGRPGVRWNLINRENTTIFHGFDNIGCFVNGRAEASYSDGGIVHTGYVNKVGDFFSDKN